MSGDVKPVLKRNNNTTEKEYLLMMKRVIAICLLIVCFTFPIAYYSMAEGCCHPHLQVYGEVHYNSLNSARHKISMATVYGCPDCDFNDAKYIETTADHQIRHYCQWVTSTLTYEYDYCSVCNYSTPGRTISH